MGTKTIVLQDNLHQIWVTLAILMALIVLKIVSHWLQILEGFFLYSVETNIQIANSWMNIEVCSHAL
jgi:hypothetical protein